MDAATAKLLSRSQNLRQVCVALNALASAQSVTLRAVHAHSESRVAHASQLLSGGKRVPAVTASVKSVSHGN